MTSLALTAIGRDRPGIVAAMSKVLFDLGCNVEDSSMTMLRGNFAMMLIVASPVDAATLSGALRPSADEMGLTFSVLEVDDRASVPSPTHVLTVYGADRPGILFRTCALLADADVNITDLDSRLLGDADAVYAVMLELEVPGSVSDLTKQLDALAAEVGVDVVLNERDLDVL